jgi:hypothetical protein
LRANDTAVAKLYHRIINYQDKKAHTKPPGMWDNRDQLLSKRLFCEIMKDMLYRWAVSSQGVDDNVSKSEVQCPIDFIEHLLYYHDRFIGKRQSSPTFLEVLLELQDKLIQISQRCDLYDSSYCKLLDEIYASTCSFCDHALSVTLLGLSSNHTELSQSLGDEPVSIGALSRLRSNSAPLFWATDLGQVISAALIRGEPDSFKAPASMWTHSFGAIRRIDYDSFDEAYAVFEESSLCAVLTNSDGLHKNNRHRLTARWVHENLGIWKQMDELATQHLLLQHHASVAAAAFEALVVDPSAAESPCDLVDACSAPRASESDSSSAADATQQLSRQMSKVLQKWMCESMDHSGVAEPFRIRGRTESSAVGCQNTVQFLLLSLVLKLSDVMLANRHVMGEVRNLTRGGGTEMTLMAIRALREGSKFNSILLTSMDNFTECASQVHVTFDQEWRKALRCGTQISSQLLAKQRAYFESYKQCIELRQTIMGKWQQLESGLRDSQLDEDMQRILLSRGTAYRRLAAMPSSAPAISWIGPPQASSMIGNGAGYVQQVD